MDPNEHRRALEKPSAWIQEGLIYKKYIDDQKDLNVYCIVELGVDYGYSTFTLAYDFPKALVIAVDNFSYDGDQSRRDHLQQHLPNYTNIRLIEHDSADLGKRWRNHDFYVNVDVLHIDADHGYNEVKADFEAWEPHVVPGGVVMFHDVSSYAESVGRFFAELEGQKYVERNLGVWIKPS